MDRRLLEIYWNLPAALRSCIASAQGWVLQRRRYGPETEGWVREALERDRWPLERLEKMRAERLKAVLERAVKHVPYYREYWRQRQESGDKDSWRRLENWPILEKAEVRARHRELIADDIARTSLFAAHTSGSTGSPMTIWRTQAVERSWYALFEARWRRWYGVSLEDRWAILGGQLVASPARTDPPFWTWNAPMRQLYMSAYHLSSRSAGHYLDAVKKYRPAYILGYSSALAALAMEAERLGASDLGLKVVITNAEPLYDHQREIIGKGLGCPVRETYGMAEMAAAASECEHGRLHEWPEAGWVEFVEKDGPVPDGRVGELVCTGLVNDAMPLVRYRIGDRGSRSRAGERCECGRLLPLWEKVEGRTDDVLYTSDGRKIGRLDPVFKGDFPIIEAQIVQEDVSSLRVRLVPGEGFDQSVEARLARELRDRMGDVDVEFERVEAIEKTERGKFKAVVCRLKPDQIRRLAG